MKTFALIVAGGVGNRMGTSVRKQYLSLEGKPILAQTIGVFERTEIIDSIVIAAPADQIDFVLQEIVESNHFRKVTAVCAGGARRQESVWNGLQAVDSSCDIVAIHDGVRPLITSDLIARSVRVASNFGASLVACPVSSTVKVISDDGFVLHTPERRSLVEAQTPQTFRYGMIMEAYKDAMRIDFRATDDCQVAERAGVRVVMVEGDKENIKITTPVDLLLAEAIMRRRGAEAAAGEIQNE